MKQVYQYQNCGKIIICSDFNSRIGEESDYIEGVDNIPIRQNNYMEGSGSATIK